MAVRGFKSTPGTRQEERGPETRPKRPSGRLSSRARSTRAWRRRTSTPSRASQTAALGRRARPSRGGAPCCSRTPRPISARQDRRPAPPRPAPPLMLHSTGHGVAQRASSPRRLLRCGAPLCVRLLGPTCHREKKTADFGHEESAAGASARFQLRSAMFAPPHAPLGGGQGHPYDRLCLAAAATPGGGERGRAGRAQDGRLAGALQRLPGLAGPRAAQRSAAPRQGRGHRRARHQGGAGELGHQQGEGGARAVRRRGGEREVLRPVKPSPLVQIFPVSRCLLELASGVCVAEYGCQLRDPGARKAHGIRV